MRAMVIVDRDVGRWSIEDVAAAHEAGAELQAGMNRDSVPNLVTVQLPVPLESSIKVDVTRAPPLPLFSRSRSPSFVPSHATPSG